MNETYQRITKWTRGYDKRSEGYSCHGVEVRFIVIGAKGAVQFVLYTNWMPSHMRHQGSRLDRVQRCLAEPMPCDLGYHSPTPMYEDQTAVSETCEYLGGAPCYYDGSSLNAEDPFDVLTDDGEDALWKFLELFYEATFNGANYPPELGRRWKAQTTSARA